MIWLYGIAAVLLLVKMLMIPTLPAVPTIPMVETLVSQMCDSQCRDRRDFAQSPVRHHF